MVHTAPPRRRKSPFGAEFDLLDDKTQLTILRVIGGRDPLVSVNKPGGNPNVQRFFQNPANQRLITSGPSTRRSRGFDVAGNQAAVDRRIADNPLTEARGVPRRSPGETDTDFHARLVGSGKTDDEALDLVAQRTVLEQASQKRETDRGAALEAKDRRRRAAGLPTSADKARRQEEFDRAATERAIARRPRHLRAGLRERAEQQFTQRRRDEDEKRLRLGLRPLHPPQLQDEPVQVESFVDGIDLNPLDHAEGQILVNRDGELARATFADRQRRAIPVKRDAFSGELLLDTSKMTADEFANDLEQEERASRRERVFGHPGNFGRELHSIDNERTGVVKALRAGTIDRPRADDALADLERAEAVLLYEFGRAGLASQKAPTEFVEGQGIGDVWDVGGVLVHRKQDGEIARLGTSTSGDLDAGDIAKLYEQASKIVQSGKGVADLSPASADEIQRVVQDILEFQRSLRSDQAPTDSSGERAVYIDDSDESYNRLAPGTVFIGPDGLKRRKP